MSESVKETPVESNKQQQKKLAAAIMHAIDVESTFKLYSYRCIDQEQFQSRIKDLCSFYKKESQNG